MSSKPIKPLTYFYCRKDGHLIPNCPEKFMPTGFIATSLSLPDVVKDMLIECPDVKTQ